jgi:hypothetical protein
MVLEADWVLVDLQLMETAFSLFRLVLTIS